MTVGKADPVPSGSLAKRPKELEAKTDLSGSWRTSGGPYNRNIFVEARKCLATRFNLGADGPRALCLPDPPPTYHLNGMARIVQTPALTVIINEGVSNSNTTRMIFTDGRALPEEMSPTWLSYSVGRWEGIGSWSPPLDSMTEPGWILTGTRTQALRITERFHRRDFGHMDFEMTLEDPKTFSRPITFRADKTLAADTEILETVCENKDTPNT